MVDAESLAHFVDRQSHGGRSERGVAGVDARRGELHGIGGAVEVEPGAGSRVVLVIFDAEERDGLRAAEAVVHDHVGGDSAAGNNKVRKSLGINHVSKLIAYMAVEQEHAWENLGITVSQIIKEGGGGKADDLDLLFSGRKTMSGIPIKSSVNADQTRVDFLDLSHWGRAVLKDIDFFEVNGNTVFPIYGASGGLAASYIFYFDTAFQVWSDSPRSGAFVDTLARPSGY